MKVCNADRLRETIDTFAQFGKTENNGVTRLSLTKEDLEARQYFIKCCEELGMSIKFDDMANIYATLPGKKDIPPIVMGSHLDSVEKGGRFDGVLGVITPLEVVRTLRDLNIELDTPITLVNFTNEEGARFDPAMMSSGVLTGKFDKDKMLQSQDKHNTTFGEALNVSGFKGDELNRLKEASAFIELHIEQGPVLESEHKDIGVVEGVLGIVCYEITVLGESNHAGTTPMKHRKDPLFVVADLITKLRNGLAKLDEELVYTMGRVNVSPNIHTVIPNCVTFTLESRHQNPKVIQQVEEAIRRLPDVVEGCSVSYEKLWGRDTVIFDSIIIDSIEAACEQFGYSSRRMYSGAGHDAQYIAGMVPTAMIFVPSVNGRSHCEEELTTYEDCYKGANVLLQTLLTLHEHHTSKEAIISKAK